MEYMKKNMGIMIMISLLTIAPTIFGVCNWSAVPAELLTNFVSAQGTYMKKELLIFVIPVIFLVVFWVLMLSGVGSEKFRERQGGFQVFLAYAFCPVLSNLCSIGIYKSIFGF